VIAGGEIKVVTGMEILETLLKKPNDNKLLLEKMLPH